MPTIELTLSDGTTRRVQIEGEPTEELINNEIIPAIESGQLESDNTQQASQENNILQTQEMQDALKESKARLGRGLEAASFHPVFNIPYIGTGLGGGLYSVGDALVNDNPDLLGAAGRGFVLGETVGAVPYVGKVLTKVPGIKQGANLVGKAANKIAQTKAGQVVGDLTNRALNNAYVKAAGDFLTQESPLAQPIRMGIDKMRNLPSYFIPGIEAKTIQRAVNPNSVALDLNNDTAQNLLMNTTEDVRNAYNTILNEKGNQVGKLLNELPQEPIFNKEEILNDINNIYSNYSLSNNPMLNPAKNATKREYAKINDLLDNSVFPEEVSPQELYDINKNISNMVRWDDANAKTANDVLQQIYGSNAEKIADLSPELAQANKEYTNLMDFKKNEGVNTILSNRNNLDTASSKLKNYNSTVTKGNTNRNIQDLENVLVANGYEPFLGKIDDVNAAMDLLNSPKTGFNPLGLGQVIKNGLFSPSLKLARGYNRITQPIDEMLSNGSNSLVQRLLAPLYIDNKPIYGGISNTSDDYTDFDYNKY